MEKKPYEHLPKIPGIPGHRDHAAWRRGSGHTDLEMVMAKVSSTEIPISRNLGLWKTKEFYITAAEWSNEFGNSYEIGIRHRITDGFTLLQKREWTETSVQIAGKLIAILLDRDVPVGEIEKLIG